MMILLITLSTMSFILTCYFSYVRIARYLKTERGIKNSLSDNQRIILVIYKSTIAICFFGGVAILVDSFIKMLKTPPNQILWFGSTIFILMTIYVIVTILFPIRLLELQLDDDKV